MSMTMTTEHDPRRGRWIPWAFAGAMLLVVAVNLGMVWAALTTFTGVTVSRAYERGRAYDQVLDEAARQRALGWQAQVALDGGALRVVVRDRDGQPVSGAIQGVLRRPLEGTDLPLQLAASAPGAWAATIAAPQPGQWEARLTLTGPGGQHFDIRQRVMVR